MRETLMIDPTDQFRGMHSYRKLHGHYIEHLDVVDYAIECYWSYGNRPSGTPIRCYAKYSPINQDIVLVSFPGQAHEVTDIITKERAPYCQIVGSLFNDFKLVEQLRFAEMAAGLK